MKNQRQDQDNIFGIKLTFQTSRAKTSYFFNNDGRPQAALWINKMGFPKSYIS